MYNKGTEEDPALGLAFDYLTYLGTESKSAEEIASRMYALACNFNMRAASSQSTIGISGLSENMEEALSIVRDLLANAVPDEAILANLKADELKSRADSKLSQRRCFSAMTSYAIYGPEYVSKVHLSSAALAKVTSDELLSKVRDLIKNGCEVLYYGPMGESEMKAAVPFEGSYTALPLKYPNALQTPEPAVLLAPFEANNIYYLQYSNRGETFEASEEPGRTLFNEYFGGGMNTIVFQEMREARGLAYSASAYLATPTYKEGTFYFDAFIATQNDKMRQAVEAFDDIINNMPESEPAFAIAKDALDGRYRTQRTTGSDVLWSYRACRLLGMDEPLDKAVFEALPGLTLEDVKAIQQKWVKDRTYTYAILGDPKDLDMDFLKSLGPVKIVPLDEVFGY